VSVYFEVSGVLVWNPSNAVGLLYADQLAAASRFAGLDSGLSDLTAGGFVLDPVKFGALINELVHTYDRSTHAVLRHQLQAVLAPSLVMLSRSGVACETPADDALRGDVARLDAAMPV
jgi:hypothetical protein